MRKLGIIPIGIIIMLVAGTAWLYGSPNEPKKFAVNENQSVIFPNSYEVGFKEYQRWTPDWETVKQLEKPLQQCLKKEVPDISKKLSTYKRQYVGLINQQGEKIVWVNFFAYDFDSEDWQQDLVIVDDGGDDFFNIKINIENKRCFDLIVNGVA